MKMAKSKVYFISAEKMADYSQAGRAVLEKVMGEQELKKQVLIKIHPGALGNTSYLKPEVYEGIIDLLEEQGVEAKFAETCMESNVSSGKEKEFVEHGFTRLPYVITDGKDGNEYNEVEVEGGKHFKTAAIAKGLAEAEQVVVASHFKGHCMAGFGGAVKMLGIGFACGLGKAMVHAPTDDHKLGEPIEWDNSHLPGKSAKWVWNWNDKFVSSGRHFRERVAEYATAAGKNKPYIYVTFAIQIVNNCDCEGSPMEPVYKDLGVLASTDPVAIDAAALSLLTKREGEMAFEGQEMLEEAEKLGLGSQDFEIIEV